MKYMYFAILLLFSSCINHQNGWIERSDDHFVDYAVLEDMLKDEGIFYLSPEEKKKLKEQKKIDVNIRNGNYATLLHEACYQGRIAVVRELIAKNADINAENCYGAIPLGYAILKNHYDIAELLLENGADPNGHVSTDSGWSRSVLVQAIAFDENPKMAALLKKYGANLNHRGKYGQTDAHSSYYYCDHLKKLLKAGLNLNVKDNFGKNAFFYLPSGFQIENEEIDGIVKLLKKSGLDINRHEEITKNTGEYVDFINPLIQAVIDGDYARTEILLRNGARIEAGAWAMQSVTPLHIAAMAGDYEMVKLLVERGASIEGWHYWRVTPLSSAADLGKDYPRDVLRVDHSSEEYAKIVELLIEKGANVNNVEKYENTPLHHAVEGGCEKIVRILLKHGAKIDAANCDKETPLDVAKKLGKLKIQKIMEEAQKGMGK